MSVGAWSNPKKHKGLYYRIIIFREWFLISYIYIIFSSSTINIRWLTMQTQQCNIWIYWTIYISVCVIRLRINFVLYLGDSGESIRKRVISADSRVMDIIFENLMPLHDLCEFLHQINLKHCGMSLYSQDTIYRPMFFSLQWRCFS